MKPTTDNLPEIENTTLARYFGTSEGNVRYHRSNNPAKYEEMVNEYMKASKSLESLDNNKYTIMMLGFKGGVGKTSLAHIFNEYFNANDESIILNLDISRNIKDYTDLPAANIVDLKDGNEVDADLLLEVLHEDKKFAILDTPGNLEHPETREFLPFVDFFVIPFGVAKEEIDEAINTAEMYFFHPMSKAYDESKPLKILFVLNNYKDDNDLKYIEIFKEHFEKMLSQYNFNYPSFVVEYSRLKTTKAINTMGWKKQQFAKLSMEMAIAYKAAKKNMDNLFHDFKKLLQTNK
ncbi:hypothetical protein [Aquamicrobium sp.]|uniref:hypothetical protein n=1 Tax=Aquamicrobium sp. TaxID=1872579 RepID=UPI00258DBF95|nr:hypothetical protein [Aquamicrobium sp.]MCK9549485.1 hypothetical protein [Aquamicrobium sp.]